MRQIETATTKAKNPSTGNFEDVTWGGISVRSASGSTNYNDLTNKPTINGVTVQGTLTTGDLLITAADVGALPNSTKYGAAFSLSIDSGTFVITAQLKDQDGNDLGAAQTIDLPLETMVVGGSYDDQTQKIILTLKNGQTVEFSVSDLVSGLQTELSATNKLNPAYIDYDSTHAAVSEADKTNWSGKQDVISDLSTIRSGAAAGATAVQPSALSDYQTKLSGTNKLDPSYIDYDASHRAVSDAEKSTWNGKQDTISDLDTIRSGAVAGATALQQSDVTSTYSSSGTAPVNGTAVNAAIETLDVSSVGGSGKYISAIREEDGKISATEATMDTTPTANSTVPVTSGGVAASQAAQDAEIAWNVNQGVKNLFPYGDLIGITTNFSDKPFSLQAGDYKLSFQISATTGSYAIRVKDASNNSIFYETGSNSATTKTYDMTLSVNAATITFYSSVSNNFTNIMIRPASITDPTFQLYALPNPTLTPAAIKAVDEGAKNLVNAPSGTDVRVIDIPVVLQPGDYHVLFENITTTDTDASTCQFGAFADDNSQASNYPQLKRENNTGAMFTVTKQTSYVRLYASSSFAGGAGDTVTFTGCMICTAADWAVSQKFVPYCPPLPDIFKWEEYECLYTSSQFVIAKLNTTTSSVKVRINKALRRVVITYKLVFIANFVTGTDKAFGFGTMTPIANYASYYPFESVGTFNVSSDYTMGISKGNTNALIAMGPISGTIASGTTLSGQFEYTY